MTSYSYNARKSRVIVSTRRRHKNMVRITLISGGGFRKHRRGKKTSIVTTTATSLALLCSLADLHGFQLNMTRSFNVWQETKP